MQSASPLCRVARRAARWSPARGAALGALGARRWARAAISAGTSRSPRAWAPTRPCSTPGPADWTPAADLSLLAHRRPMRVVVDETPVLLLAGGDRVFALHDRCSHRGCSLSEGAIEGDEVVCACHGSRFALADGSVRGGPATAPQPAFEVREPDGRIEIRRRPQA